MSFSRNSPDLPEPWQHTGRRCPYCKYNSLDIIHYEDGDSTYFCLYCASEPEVWEVPISSAGHETPLHGYGVGSTRDAPVLQTEFQGARVCDVDVWTVEQNPGETQS